MQLKDTETTRYLCASAYSNEAFCQQVIEQTLEEDRQALAPCYGFHLPTVVKHCLIASSKRRRRDLKLTSLFGAAILFSLIGGSLGLFSLVVLYVVAVVIIYQERWNIRHVLVKNNFSKNSFDPDSVDWESELNSSSSNTSEETAKKIQEVKEELEKIAKEQNSKAVIYGRYSPFVGCGYDIGGWSFSLNTSKGKESLGKVCTPIPFEVNEMYEQIARSINEIHLYGIDVSVEDIYYIDGQVIRDDTRFLNNPFERPSTCLQFLEASIEEPAKANRFYKRIQIVGWKGELIVSIVLRFTKFGKNLFMEAKYFLLPPLQESFHAIDRIQSPATFMQKVDLVWQSLIISVFILPLSFSRTVYELLKPLIDTIKQCIDTLIIKENPIFNYGSVTSIRENVSSTLYRQYFQILDKDMYLKVIESALLEEIVEFLDNKDIDTSELKGRQSQILNEGIIMSGGEIRAKSLAVGRRARALFKRAKTIEQSRRDTSKTKGS
ncbi:hypothetical protein ACQ4M3_06345 [Leptolyngbya sp. AN03gr2]|uniref:hypothetical protein n=1 Tax=unclassified Leptolyngbya TaxID=2650499 RepID=UPI003D313B21